MDGVIVDSNPFHKKAYREFCKKHGLTLTDRDFDQKISGRTNKSALAALFGENLSARDVRRYEEEKEAEFRRLFDKSVKPLPGLERFLESLKKAGVPAAIGTSAPRENLRFVLKKTGLARYFDVFVDSHGIKRGKPDPEIYLKAARRVRRLPECCIVIEDSFPGVEAARRAGMKCIAVTTSHTKKELSHADLVVRDFRSLEPARVAALLD
jgi:beta-phosphoglucomutase family hydrolase